MIPKFSSQTDMMGFIRALPETANYRNMLKTDFGIDAPADAQGYQVEYLFKYLVQGTYKGIDQSELMQYAAAGVEKLAKTLPHITMKEIYAVKPVDVQAQMVPKAKRVMKAAKVRESHPDGAIVFLDHRQIWVGYFGGKIQCSKKTEAAVKEYLSNKFGV